jgi:pyridoxal 5'-phosphate synthase pdxT subunit
MTSVGTPKIGVLALQGAVREHLRALEKAGADPVSVKWPEALDGLSGLVIPGGESTTIGKLMVKYGFIEAIKSFSISGRPVYGTCAGLILIAKSISEGSKPWLELMDIEARRNAFGRQQESFEAELDIKGFDAPFTGVFIRAPWIEKTGPKVDIMAEYDGKIVMAREETLLATAFHPELTDDPRVHEYFVKMVKEA